MESILNELFEEFERKEDYKVLVENLRRKRGVFKRKTTFILKKLLEFKKENKLSVTLAKSQVAEVEKNGKRIEEYDLAIVNIMLKAKEVDSSYYETELDNQASYKLQTELDLDEFIEFCATKESSAASQTALLNVVSQ